MKNPAEYPWSSHSAYLGEKAIPWLTTDFVLSQFGEDLTDARRLYLDFVEAGMNEGHRSEFHTGFSDGRVLGDDKFNEKVLSLAEKKSKIRWTHAHVIESICLIYRIDKKVLCEQGKR
jgi:putative transposase